MIDLPDWPQPNGVDIGLQDFGGFNTPSLGGPVQRVNRMGSRFKINVSLPPLTTQKWARKWVARLVRGKSEGVRMPLPLLDFEPGTPGDVLVDGFANAGMNLAVKNVTPYYVFREGQPFSIETSGKHHLYQVATETIADATGHATLPLTVMLRRPHLNSDKCHFGKPMIEGFIQGDELTWTLSVERLASLSFDIAESQ